MNRYNATLIIISMYFGKWFFQINKELLSW